MAEQFRDCFVGEKGYEALKKLMKNGNEFCIEYAKCLQERYDAEVAYVKALRKSTDTTEKLAGKVKGSLSQVLTTISKQTNIESEAHHLIADVLLNQISIPMKNLAETQYKERKSIEETLNGKFKTWKDEKEKDNKHRTRQFEKCKEIEQFNIKVSEMSKTTKSSTRDGAKEGILSSTLVTGCVLPGGRHTSASEKSTYTSDAKAQLNVEVSLRKAEEDLEKIDRKYHTATKDVELAREACDAEMCKSSDQMQDMELQRIRELEKFNQIYTSAIQALSDTMYQVSQDLNSMRISPEDDIVVEARSSVQTGETEILLYDIYAENEQNPMSEQRRTLSLMRWMEMLKNDIEIQKRSNNASFSFLSSSASRHKPIEEGDDGSSSSDGAMCSTSSHPQKDTVVNDDGYRDGSSSSSNDDDGAMHHGKDKKRDKRKKEAIGNSKGYSNDRKNFSSEAFIGRQSVRLLQSLYEASLYKIEKAYNHLKRLPEPQYIYSQCFAKTFNDKGYPITVLRIPFQSSTHTPPSAPPAAKCFVQAMPMFAQPPMPQLLTYSTQRQAPPAVGWAVDQIQTECSAPVVNVAPRHFVYPAPKTSYNRTRQAVPPYPVLPSTRTLSTDSSRQKTDKHVQVKHPYVAKHRDELTIQPGDVIMVIERRSDQWCKGNLNGKIGLFPGNYAEDV